MNTFLVYATDGVLIRSFLGLAVTLLFFFAAVVLAMFIRHRRWKRALIPALLLGVIYFFAQCLLTAFVAAEKRDPADMMVVGRIVSLPWPLLLGILLVLTAAEALLFRDVLIYEHTHINAMSVKEAMDSLPSGICFFTPNGKVRMVNRAMEDFCRAAVGVALLDGRRFRDRLFSGDILPGCEFVPAGDTPVIVLPDGSAETLRIPPGSVNDRSRGLPSLEAR